MQYSWNWKLKNETGSFNKKLTDKFSPIILQLLFNREIKIEEDIEKFLNSDYEKNISDPFLFSEMDKAIKRIELALKKREKIAVFGDYDADGVTATVLISEALRDLGAEKVIPYIPDRQIEGYGMNMEALNFLQKEGVNLIITVDCGITNVDEVKKAKELGMDVIITDHHHIPSILPEVVAILNPHMEDEKKGIKYLAGVGVAFKLAEALYQKIQPEKKDQTKWMLDLVAIGTIADCVPLLGENRALVKYGLIVLSKTRRVGLQEMFGVGKISVSEDDIPDTHRVAFQISPRINAAGRMDHANVAYNLLIEKKHSLGRVMALELEGKNQERQKVTAEIVREIKIIAENSFRDKKFIYVANEHWPVGLLGLVAGKIADEFKKPTMILQKQANGLAGSLRSIPQINIIETLEKCAEFLEKFGGHSQAAGVRIKNSNLEKFCAKMSKLIEYEMENNEIDLAQVADLEIKAEDIGWELMLELKKMEPFGEGNKEPIFIIKNLVVEDTKIVGNGNKHLKMFLRAIDGSPKIFDAICFGRGEEFCEIKKGDKIDIACNLNQDEWNGNKKIQLKVVDLKIVQ
jgi:single-stranded-DNA-specific exonuclease